MDDRGLKTIFLLKHFSLFIERLCYTHSFDTALLRDYKDIWRWDLISFNENIDWSLDFMLEFQDYLDFGQGDAENETKWINLNRAIPWSCEILEAFEDKLQWRELSINHKVSGDSDIRAKFYHRLLPYISGDFAEELQREEVFFNNSDHEELDELAWMVDYVESFNDHQELCWHEILEIENAENINWTKLSQNVYLPWSEELIARYADSWDWACLSINESLPWSMGLIDRFVNEWEWGGLSDANEHGDKQIIWGLTSNEYIFWTPDMLDNYKNQHDWFHLSYACNAEWTAELLVSLMPYLQDDQLLFNESIWTQVLHDMTNGEEITRMIRLYELRESICLN